ncbi:MAG: ribosome biogenesis factor YjgA [Woeseiaceae bacterium]|nr:ribosome biogenesis factor YjgA [Woeseiaceae bacterium]
MPAGSSKSEQKRAAQATRALAERLLTLTPEQLAGLPLTDELRAAVHTTRTLRARSALRRQRLYLAGLLRREDTGPLEAALARLDGHRRGERELFHEAERWRDRLLQEGQPALAEFARRAGRDNPRLRQLLADVTPAHARSAAAPGRARDFSRGACGSGCNGTVAARQPIESAVCSVTLATTTRTR